MAKPKNICIRESYTNAQGEEKVSWNRIGILFVGKNGNEYIKLFHIPNTLVNVFEPKEEDGQGQQQAPQQQPSQQAVDPEEDF